MRRVILLFIIVVLLALSVFIAVGTYRIAGCAVAFILLMTHGFVKYRRD